MIHLDLLVIANTYNRKM